jgi:hypothetical protein
VAEKLSAGDTWNDEAERALFDSQLGSEGDPAGAT